VVVDGLSIVNIIRKKRDSEELADDEIEWFVTAATDRLITEAQIGMSIGLYTSIRLYYPAIKVKG